MIVNIPDNKLVKFVFKPCAGDNNSLSGYDCKKADNVVYWFDKVTLEPTDEAGPGEGEEPARLIYVPQISFSPIFISCLPF